MFLAIGLGAMGAHALEEKLTANGHFDHWKTAALYHMIHGLAMFVIAGSKKCKSDCVYWSWLIGIVLFSGSLYVLSYTGFSKLGMITPLGGLSFMIGWLVLTIKPGNSE